MNKLIGLVLTGLLFVTPVNSQLLDLNVGEGGFGGGAAGFAGPGDVIASATAFYSCSRAYTAAYATATGNLCIIADVATGNTSTCTMKAATTGFADLTSSLCTGGTLTVSAFCTAHTSCVVSTMFDQTAAAQCTAPTTSCDVATATLANMPALTFSSINGLPCLTQTAAASLTTATPLNAIAAQPFTMTVVYKQTTSGTNPNVFGAAGSNPIIFAPTGGNAIALFAGSSASATAANNAYHGIQAIGNGANVPSGMSVDGTLTQNSPGTGSFGGGQHMTIGGGTAMIGSFCEGGIWPIAFSSGQQTSWFSNANGTSGYNGGL